MPVPYIPDRSVLIAADNPNSVGSAPTSGQQIEYCKLDLGQPGTSDPISGGYVPVSSRRGTKNFQFVTASGNGILLNANGNRIDATFYNNGPSTAYLGTSGIAGSGGFPLLVTASLQDTSSQDAWYFSMLSGTTTLLSYLEVS